MNIHHIAVYLHRYDLKMKKNTMALPALQRRIILHRFYSITNRNKNKKILNKMNLHVGGRQKSVSGSLLETSNIY